MSKEYNDGGPAFPASGMQGRGMSMRDAFAVAFGPEVLRTVVDGLLDTRPGETTAQCVARAAYELSDAMLTERAKC